MEFKVHHSGRAHYYTPEEIDVVVKAMNDAEPLTQSKYRNQFEQKFSEFLGVKHSFAVHTATDALELTAQLLQFDEGDEIIIPSFTFTASAYPFVKQGAKIVWADTDPKTHVITAETIKACITSNTKAILVVHIAGYVANMPEIMDLAKKHHLIVVEDNAQGIGTEINGQKSGSFGDFGIFSFHSHKNISTLGEGGMLVVKDEDIAKIIPMLRHNGHCAFDFEQEHYWEPAMGNVDIPELNGKPIMPNNYCLGEVECALGVKLLDRVESLNTEKRTRAIRFIDALADFEDIEFHRVNSTRHNYHLLLAYFPTGKRNEFFKRIVYQKQIQCIAPYYPLNRYDFYKKVGMGKANCPNTDLFWDNMISFPFHHWMSEPDFDYMLTATREVLDDLR